MIKARRVVYKALQQEEASNTVARGGQRSRHVH